MSSEVKTILRDRLKQNYEAYIAGLQGKSTSELINLASEITAAKQVCEELPDACDEEDMPFLLRFDDPLDVMRYYWEFVITDHDHSREMGYTLWRARDHMGDDPGRQDKTPITKDDILIDPVMDFSGREIVAYIEIGFDVGERFQLYPNADDVCDLYAKYDPVTQTLQAKLCIEDGYDGSKRWEPVELLPSEQEMIVGSMEEICQKDMGKSLRDTWADRHPAINRKNLQQKKGRRHQHER